MSDPFDLASVEAAPAVPTVAAVPRFLDGLNPAQAQAVEHDDAAQAEDARYESQQTQSDGPGKITPRSGYAAGKAVQRTQIGIAGGDDVAADFRLYDRLAPARYQHPPQKHETRCGAEAGGEYDLARPDDRAGHDNAGPEVLDAPGKTRRWCNRLPRTLGV